MIYSPSHNFCFVMFLRQVGHLFVPFYHIVHTLSRQTSLNFLRNKYRHSRYLYDFTIIHIHRKAIRLLSYRYENLLSFALMREPVSWLFSSFRHFKRHNMKMKHIISKPQPCIFSDYIEELISIGDLKPCQSFMLIDQNATVQVKSIGNYDHLGNYFKLICEVIGFTHPPSLPHKNKNYYIDENYDNHISNSIICLIRRHWHNDCLLFDRIIESGSIPHSLPFNPLPLVPKIDLIHYDPWEYMVPSG